MRFLIMLLPYMYLLVSYGLIHFTILIKSKLLKNITIVILIFSLIFSAAGAIQLYKSERNKADKYRELQKKFETAHGSLWVSSPVISVFSDKKVDKLMYYPVFDIKKGREMIEEVDEADAIFLDSCDLACKPYGKNCDEMKNDLVIFFKEKLETEYSSENQNCKQFVFKAIS